MAERGECLVAVYADVTPGMEAEYNRWYDTRHIPQRLAVPGYLGAARYERTAQGNTRYMAFYELANPGVLQSPAAHALSAETSDWDRGIMAAIRLESRTVYERILSLGEASGEHPPFVLTVRVNIAPEFEDDFNRWYDQEHAPAFAALPGCRGARRYRKLDGIGAKYLAVYDLDDGGLPQSPAWAKAARTDWTRKVTANIKNPLLNQGRRIF
jgi:antibiotic biosynthesis monooxygenase (ABM) superfamily enzyme